MHKLYDFFMFGFSAEADVLYLKLTEQYSYFDGFFIIETNRTHQNQPKPYYLEEVLKQPRFKPYYSKIIYEKVPVDKLNFQSVRTETDVEGLHNDNSQRDYCYLKHRNQIAADDLIYVSDCDEILCGEDIPDIVKAFNRHNLSFCHIPLLRTVYDYNNVDEDRGFWPVTIVTKKCLDEFFDSSLSKVRSLYYRNVPYKSIISIKRPRRYRGNRRSELFYLIKHASYKMGRIFGFNSAPPDNPLTEPCYAGYFGWHFSYSYKDPLENFYKLRAVAHTQHNKLDYIPHQLEIMKQNRGVTMPGSQLKPVMKTWPLNPDLFPKEIVSSPSLYMTSFLQKIQSVTAKQILDKLTIVENNKNDLTII